MPVIYECCAMLSTWPQEVRKEAGTGLSTQLLHAPQELQACYINHRTAQPDHDNNTMVIYEW